MRKYGMLRTLGTIYKILGWVILVLGIISACASAALLATGSGTMASMMGLGQDFTTGGTLVGIVMAIIYFIVMMVVIGVWAISLLAISDGINVVLDIEENTRHMAEAQPKSGGLHTPEST